MGKDIDDKDNPPPNEDRYHRPILHLPRKPVSPEKIAQLERKFKSPKKQQTPTS